MSPEHLSPFCAPSWKFLSFPLVVKRLSLSRNCDLTFISHLCLKHDRPVNFQITQDCLEDFLEIQCSPQ